MRYSKEKGLWERGGERVRGDRETLLGFFFMKVDRGILEGDE